MRGTGVLCTVFLFGVFQATALAQSFAERLESATTETLGALHEEFNVVRGDVDLDGVAAFSDFLIISNEWGAKRDALTYRNGDINLDGEVDLTDFAMHTFNFGESDFRPDPPSRPPNGNLGLSRDENGRLTVSTASPVALGGMEIVSASGGLESDSFDAFDASPFIFFLSNNENRVTWGSLTSLTNFPRLDGDFPTRLSSSADDLEIRWIEPDTYDVYSLGLGEGDGVTGRITPGFVAPPPAVDELDVATNLEELLALHEEKDIPRGELDREGGVNEGDVDRMRRSWGRTANRYSQGDLNLDGEVGLGDFAILSANWGRFDWAPDEERVIEDPADLTLTADEFGRLQLSSNRRVELDGIELVATEDNAFQTSSSAPFRKRILTTTQQSAAVNLDSPYILDNDVALGARLIPGTDHEITLRWIEDGSYTVFESEPFVLSFIPDTSFGDIDGNGTVEFLDFLTLAETYGRIVEPSTGADITGDGRVNFYDFLILSHNFGQDAPRAVQPVPEPTFGFQGLILTSGLLISFRRHRRRRK